MTSSSLLLSVLITTTQRVISTTSGWYNTRQKPDGAGMLRRRLISSLAACSVDGRSTIDPQYTQSVALPTDRTWASCLGIFNRDINLAKMAAGRWFTACAAISRGWRLACSGGYPALPAGIVEALWAHSRYQRVVRFMCATATIIFVRLVVIKPLLPLSSKHLTITDILAYYHCLPWWSFLPIAICMLSVSS